MSFRGAQRALMMMQGAGCTRPAAWRQPAALAAGSHACFQWFVDVLWVGVQGAVASDVSRRLGTRLPLHGVPGLQERTSVGLSCLKCVTRVWLRRYRTLHCSPAACSPLEHARHAREAARSSNCTLPPAAALLALSWVPTPLALPTLRPPSPRAAATTLARVRHLARIYSTPAVGAPRGGRCRQLPRPWLPALRAPQAPEALGMHMPKPLPHFPVMPVIPVAPLG